MTACAIQKPEYFRFASQVLGETFEHGPSTKVLASVGEGGRIRGVVIYDHITDFGCLMHVASDGSRRFITPAFLRWVFRVPFLQWKLERVGGIVRASKTEVLEFDLRLGFKQEGIVRRAFGHEDGILIGMLRTECRYLDEGAMR